MLIETYNFPTVAPTGWDTPDAGTTGAVLWEASNPIVQLADLLSEANVNYLYPWQDIAVLSRVQFECHVYDHRLIDVLFRYYIPRKNMGSWQILSTGGGSVIEGSINLAATDGYISFDLQTITTESIYRPYYIAEGGGSPHEGRIDQCSLWLQPILPPLPPPFDQTQSYYPADVGNVSDALLRTTGQVSPCPVDAFLGYSLRSGISTIGFYLHQGAAITQLIFEMEIVRRKIAVKSDKQYLNATCVAPPGTSIDCQAEFANFIATHSGTYSTLGACEAVGGQGQCAESTWTCSDNQTTSPYWQVIQG